MTEAEAHAWLASQHVSRETMAKLACYGELLIAENAEQNLVATSSLAQLWSRHIVDSAQLWPLAKDQPGQWVDLGSGPGLPGLIIALLDPARPMLLVEMRRKRAAFLEHCCAALGLDQVRIFSGKVEQLRLPQPAAIISARAFAPLERLCAVARHLSNAETLWLLPKGQSAASELASLHGSWHGDFTLVPSITNAAAAIIMLQRLIQGKART
jgi:16S rRNA (guanine527-N7)-methyltransferase